MTPIDGSDSNMNHLKRKYPSLAKPIESPNKQQQQQQQLQSQIQVHIDKHSLKVKKTPLTLQSTQQQSQQQKGNEKLSGDEMHQWQQSWRKIMKQSFHPFYDNNVTIIISKRHYDDKTEYSPHDIFSNVSKGSIKVWNYDKVFRFLKNLGINIQTGVDELAISTHTVLPPSLTNNIGTNDKNNLYTLLKEEKIYGSTDRDPNAKRDDLHYFTKNYLYVYDLTQVVRPIAVREWGSEYPIMRMTLDGKCPFINDPSDQNLERKRAKRMKKFQATQVHRQALKLATYKMINGISLSVQDFTGTSTSTDKIEADEERIETTRGEAEATVSQVSENIHGVMASGYNGASNAIAFSMDSNLNSAAAMAGGNGLGPVLSQVPSKKLNNLKRRILMKKKSP
ncbi:DDK kinase regulatory subunit DBF4 [Candida viswanathii]|uniref:DDK kinase regulatory subunit DBF4 n=1 Tax=Candida viswanathii TaxID=5486 RepID=A0A367YI54_9ASCO|nr:DDK kinase regulatory subunit DBF4 [Candida viswanathii]